jgi:uncharacterized damage-inducible protein DinB
MTDDLRFPIGRVQWTGSTDAAARAERIAQVAAAPAGMRRAVAGLSEAQLSTPYRSGGWTVRQVVHHVADSHMNGYGRFKLALTEDEPTIKPYLEARWAELQDTVKVPIDVSLSILDALHVRWVALLQSMSEADFSRGYVHPEMKRTVTLDEALAIYAWHGRHHAAHITALREREGWR